ncbi:MAG: hypothetical protein LBN95_07895 [Prevotellaceae bacterium]|jgi:hypothetical protein|nr:hypothetical protein [Prevotellaceae bacterium]
MIESFLNDIENLLNWIFINLGAFLSTTTGLICLIVFLVWLYKRSNKKEEKPKRKTTRKSKDTLTIKETRTTKIY